MKKLLNTLYVSTQGTYLSREGETVLARVEKETRLQLPIHTLSGIVCFGQVSCSPPLLGLCAERGVGVSFLTEHGRFLARLQGPVAGNVLLRRQQYRWADDDMRSAELARSFLIGKVANCRTVLQRALRDHGEKSGAEALEKASLGLRFSLDQLPKLSSLDALRGLEGDAAGTYFGVFGHLITSQKEDFQFNQRSRRPPLDRVNCLLSFVYTLLMHDIRGALETVGLDPAVGFLHRDRPGRASLALDILEEFRPVLADRLALSLINLGMVRKNGFRQTETGAVIMDDDLRKTLLLSYQKRKQEVINHPFLNEKVEIGLLPFVQSMLLARHIRGDLDGYPPLIWR